MTLSATQNFRWVAGTNLTRQLPTGATAIAEGDPVKLSSNKMVPITADGDTVFAIAAKDNPANEDGVYHVASGDVFIAQAGEALGAGDTVYIEGATKELIKTGLSSGDLSVGIVPKAIADQAYGEVIIHLAADQQFERA